ncbi:alpha/beta hydrolase [Actinomadura kijaniata]|uniref:alpha/beta hydrolase n=1 Tax=Actinomadura kijaniata TaxID=46161 RepID=UPI000835858D|nr:alpha/beta hydrolase [Actinomadura kijaniata]
MTGRRDIEFAADDGVRLRGWFYPARGTSGPAPAVVLAAGFAMLKEQYLDRYAERFAAAGFGALVCDPRNFGASDGEPRQEANPWQQIEDLRHAVTYAGLLPEVDARRIGVWGTHYGGAHAVVLGASDPRVRAVVAQAPAIDGISSGRRRIPMDRWPNVARAFAADRAARMGGEPAALRPIVGHPAERPVFGGDAAREFFLAAAALAPGWRNEVTVRTGEWSRMYDAGRYAELVAPVPLLMVLGDGDTLSGTDLQLDAYQRAREPKRLVLYRGDHHDAYLGRFEETSAAAVDFLGHHLAKEDDR